MSAPANNLDLDLSMEELTILERLLDKYGPGAVLNSFADVCSAKAAFMAEMLQLADAAKPWMTLESDLKALAQKNTTTVTNYLTDG